MLSILIPVYNFDIRELVNGLVAQGMLLEQPFEIIALDDGSEERYRKINQTVRQWPEVQYLESPVNMGRSKIRNQLGQLAAFEYLLFMDCDSKVNHDSYLEQYLNHLEPDRLLYGGRTYSKQAPANQALYLHWLIGTKREVSLAKDRKRAPYHSFMTNNFVIPKLIFQKFPFDEQLTQYGHEDTLFGLQLKNASIPISHLDNPLEHIGLEQAEVFLRKTEQALENLNLLTQKNKLMETKLLNRVRQLKSMRLAILVKWLLDHLITVIRQNLLGRAPQAWQLDLYKLWYYLQLN